MKKDYKLCFELAWEKMHPQGLIIADNISYQGRKHKYRQFVPAQRSTRSETMQKFLSNLSLSPNDRGYFLGVGDGVLVAHWAN